MARGVATVEAPTTALDAYMRRMRNTRTVLLAGGFSCKAYPAKHADTTAPLGAPWGMEARFNGSGLVSLSIAVRVHNTNVVTAALMVLGEMEDCVLGRSTSDPNCACVLTATFRA